ncbi:MAG: GNAT family N-acetyltransferase [Anaerolineales bacterium]|nr:MAG: GNAT family N-acetyltransferase [Anaerolineales bacterium]
MLIRPFDGSRRDAEGLLAVERGTFAESPYNADEVIHLLTNGEQRAWLAILEGEVAGFVTAFLTCTLHGRNWEVDLVAVQPVSQGQGMATELIKAAVEGAGGHSLSRSQIAPAGFAIQRPSGGLQIRHEQKCDLLSLDKARALVATDNLASQRAFTKAGFIPEETIYDLLLYEIRGFVPRPLDSGPVTVRDLALSAEEAGAVLRLGEGLTLRPDDVLNLASRKANEILVAVRRGQIAGFAELLYVETLLYRGIWLESVIAQGADREIQAALISEAVERAKRKGLDEIGCLVRTRRRGMAEGAEKAKNMENHLLREALIGQGCGVVNEYYIYRRGL